MVIIHGLPGEFVKIVSAGGRGLARLGMALTGDRRLSLVMVAVWAVAPAS